MEPTRAAASTGKEQSRKYGTDGRNGHAKSKRPGCRARSEQNKTAVRSRRLWDSGIRLCETLLHLCAWTPSRVRDKRACWPNGAEAKRRIPELTSFCRGLAGAEGGQAPVNNTLRDSISRGP